MFILLVKEFDLLLFTSCLTYSSETLLHSRAYNLANLTYILNFESDFCNRAPINKSGRILCTRYLLCWKRRKKNYKKIIISRFIDTTVYFIVITIQLALTGKQWHHLPMRYQSRTMRSAWTWYRHLSTLSSNC